MTSLLKMQLSELTQGRFLPINLCGDFIWLGVKDQISDIFRDEIKPNLYILIRY